jgi:hypothetical protein
MHCKFRNFCLVLVVRLLIENNDGPTLFGRYECCSASQSFHDRLLIG